MQSTARYYRALLTLLVLVVAWGAPAADADELKVGFVNTAKVLEQAPQAEQARKKLENEFAPRDKALVAAQKKLKKLEDKLTTDGAIMNEAKRREIEREILSQKRDIKRSQEEFREDFNIRRNEELGKLQRLVIKAIGKLAREQKFDMIVGDNSVLFASERVDITERVLQVLREEFKNGTSDKSTSGGN
ncbi:MAG TPA: OmpH family outer membrane protein [Gammaproteobacteria bacterium]|nr:OmpH family outer membrane protein [Gammaproteobacteria bacterium]